MKFLFQGESVTESKIPGHLSYRIVLYKYSSYDYRVIFFMSKCVYIFWATLYKFALIINIYIYIYIYVCVCVCVCSVV
jgi:hypothetical protein